jgi:hypothetical protein
MGELNYDTGIKNLYRICKVIHETLFEDVNLDFLLEKSQEAWEQSQEPYFADMIQRINGAFGKNIDAKKMEALSARRLRLVQLAHDFAVQLEEYRVLANEIVDKGERVI